MTTPGETLAKAALELQLLVATIGDDRWRAGATPVPREDTTERSKGMVSDPTPSIVNDGRRQQLSDRVQEAEAFMAKAARHLGAMTRHLNDTYEKWQG